jgi:hypothetical protein
MDSTILLKFTPILEWIETGAVDGYNQIQSTRLDCNSQSKKNNSLDCGLKPIHENQSKFFSLSSSFPLTISRSVRHPDMNVDDFNPVCAQGFNDLILPSEVNLHLFDSEHDGGSFGTFCGVLLSKR